MEQAAVNAKRNRFGFWVVFVVMAAFPTAKAQTATEIVGALHLQKFEWLAQKDTAALANLLHPEVVYIHSNGWHESKTDVLNNLVSGKLAYHNVLVEKATVRVFNQTAVVNGVGVFEVALNGTPLTIKLDYTEVYSYEAGWKLVSRHACRIE